MKLLWITNTLFPEPSNVLGLEPPVFGGWMYGLAEQLGKNDGVELAIATVYKGNVLKKIVSNGVMYYLLPVKDKTRYNNELENIWKDICLEFQPDIVHVHGTEYTHGLACMRILPHLRYVISIQGLVSIIVRYYNSGLTFFDIVRNWTFRDIVKRDNLFQAKNKLHESGLLEKEYIKRTKNVIGRTCWDLVHVKAMNEKVDYYFCNESLRNKFYSAEKWSLNNCTKYSIFLSQAGYPLKGLHQVIKALSFLSNLYPNIKLRVGGQNIINRKTIKDRIKLSGYGKYICRLIKKYELQNNVVFLGTLTEEQMIVEYQNAHVFICPSSIENSPNSLGEAQIIGTPVIASYVGGIPDMIENNVSGLLYRFEEIEMLAKNVCQVFENEDLSLKLSKHGVLSASVRHNKDENFKRILSIYSDILDCK